MPPSACGHSRVPIRALWLGFAFFAPLSVAPTRAQQASYAITTVAGVHDSRDGGKATDAPLLTVESVVVDRVGNFYLADSSDHRVRKVSANGVITTVAGTGQAGYSGDGGPANKAALNSPYGLAIDPAGNLLIADYGNARVRRVTTDGLIATVAGGGTKPAQANGGDALAANLVGPRNVATDNAGNVYVSDASDHRIYRVTIKGRIELLAGVGVAGYEGDGIALSAPLNFPTALAVDKNGTVVFADTGNKRIRQISADGKISVVAGEPRQSVAIETPTGLGFDLTGNLCFSDSVLNRITRRQADGTFLVVSGADPPLPGPVRGFAIDGFGRLYVIQGRQVLLHNGVTAPVVVAGKASTENEPLKEGVAALYAPLSSPMGIALDPSGNLFVAEETGRRVRRINTDGTIHTVAGSPNGYVGDGKPAIASALADPVGVAYNPLTGLLIADYEGNRVQLVGRDGVLRTLAGDGVAGFGGDQGPAARARLNRPRGVAVDHAGNVYIADSLNHRIRVVGAGGQISTIAGRGVRSYSGDGGQATQATFNSPQGVWVDANNNLFIADTGNHAIRRVTPYGIISTVAGTGTRGNSGDAGKAVSATLNAPAYVTGDGSGALFIADTYNHQIRRVSPSGIIDTIAGSGTAGLTGDDGPATLAQLRTPTSLAITPDGTIFVADLENNRIRKLSPLAVPQVANIVDERRTDLTVMSAASLRQGPIAPGQLISLFGKGIGPERPESGRFASSGGLPTELAKTQVLIGGRPVPLLFASPDQINAQVPYALAAGREAEVQVLSAGNVRASTRVAVNASAPAIFTSEAGAGQAVAVTENGTLNSAANTAARGSTLVFYATGAGALNPLPEPGVPASAPLPKLEQQVRVLVGTAEAEVLYAGLAPGFVGVAQINVRLPGVFTPPGIRPLTLVIGGESSQPGVTIALR